MFPRPAKLPGSGLGSTFAIPAMGMRQRHRRYCDYRAGWLVVAVGVVSSACVDPMPNVNEAQIALAAVVDSGRASRLVLHGFQKRDGMRAEVNGVKQYHLEFRAMAVVHQGLMADLSSTGITTRQLVYADTARSFHWGGWFSRQVQGQVPLLPYDRIALDGTLLFVLMESGWRAAQVRFDTRVDSTLRSTMPEDLVRPELRPLLGQWYDGGPDCASVEPRHWTPDVVVLKYWYCEVGEENAAERELTSVGGVIRDRLDEVRVFAMGSDSLGILIRVPLKDHFGNDYGPFEAPRIFERSM